MIALAGLDPKAAAARAVDLAKTLPDPSDVFTAFLGRKGGPEALAAALAGKALPPDAAKIGLRVAQGSGKPDVALVDALRKAGGLTGRADLDAKALDDLVAEVRRSGDPARGEAIFRRTDLACLRCNTRSAEPAGRSGPTWKASARRRPGRLPRHLDRPAR